MQFSAAVKSDSTGMLKGTYQCTPAPDGLHLARKKQTVVVIPRGSTATHTGSNQVTVQTPGGTLVLAVSKFPAYQGRLAGAVAAFLRGERNLEADAEFKLEPYLLVPAVLPFGIMIVTRGGAIWGALGGGVAVACLAIAQVESIPRAGRLAIILVINAALYAGIIALMSAATATGQRV
jgi:hypothetical protein